MIGLKKMVRKMVKDKKKKRWVVRDEKLWVGLEMGSDSDMWFEVSSVMVQ